MRNRIGRLKKMAEETGEPIEKLIERVMREEGSTLAAARKLGVAPNAIRYWLLKLGFRPEFHQAVTWEKPEETEAATE